ncbi:steroid 17-alpha-hydroxylase/17,20 lyase-like [Saccostrea echinata]|uniref:steroid 17-alpha-hydroxylase/17,20 lyase-like n=1 Tax=Saccostrea echinata TaxID=191078 RepID=UPI002A806C2B|nr:steroid 17-alpha-hydroxylase/17,20 lyase-like [Saccostrea echinata]
MISLSLNTQTLVVSVCVGLLVYYVIKRLRYRLPPGPWCIPVIGHYQIYSAPSLHRQVVELSKTYGPVVRLSVGPSTWVFLNNFDVVLEALVKRNADFAGRTPFPSGEMFTEGGKDIVLSTYTPTWKFHRKVAGKALRHYLQGDLLENMIQDNMTKFLDKMAEEKEPFEFSTYANLMVYHQLYTICFGEKKSPDDPEVMSLLKLDEELIETWGVGLFMLFEDAFPYLKDICPTKTWRNLTRITEDMFKVIRTKFYEHKATFQSGVNRDFTDSLLKARQEAENEGDEDALEKLTDTHLIQTIMDIFLAGTETTRFTMDWFMSFISGIPEIQMKCQEEIDRVVGSDRISMKHRNALDFTEACLFETWRRASLVALSIPHATICDTKVGGYDIPKGTTVLINIWALHNDPNYWKDPEKFDPYRFLDENGKLKPTRPESWLPFSAGRRVCLGETLARPDILLMCANLLQRFEIHLPEGVKPQLGGKVLSEGMDVPVDYKIVVRERQKQ